MASTTRSFFKGRGGGMTAAARTHAGKTRSTNQDTFVCAPEKGVFAVIDGMGGAQAGEVAADLTRRAVLEDADREDDLRLPLSRANETIYRRASRNPGEQGMGCVATVARADGPDLTLAHVGDTRAFLASAAGCEQLTRDHTLVADIQEQQGLTETAAARMPGQHQVTRDIGGRPHEDLSWIDTAKTSFEADDLLLLCTDGLSDLVRDRELFQLLGRARRERQEVADLVNRLIELALERGARDNVTVAVVRRDKVSRKPARRRRKRPRRRRPEPRPRGPGTGTEQVESQARAAPAPRRRGGLGLLVRSLALLAALASAFALGWTLRPRWSSFSATALQPVADGGLQQAVSGGRSLVEEGPAGLGGRFERNATVTALGPLEVDGDLTQTRVAAGVALTFRGARLRFPRRPATWEIHLGPGSRLVLQQVSIRSPLLTVRAVFDDGDGRLVVEDSHLDVAELQAQGPEGARMTVSGGVLHQRTGRESPVLEGPAFESVPLPDPPRHNSDG